MIQRSQVTVISHIRTYMYRPIYKHTLLILISLWLYSQTLLSYHGPAPTSKAFNSNVQVPSLPNIETKRSA